MESHFDMMGDDMGNTEGQIHLDPVTKKTIYKEYCEDMEDSGDVVLAFSTFKNLWYTCFPHVKIREYKVPLILKDISRYLRLQYVFLGGEWEMRHLCHPYSSEKNEKVPNFESIGHRIALLS